ncbi:hypothetical protein DW083_17225 [Parabacteroides sp. AF48-14]|nr:hypothetical protein DW083_17225 [Parabacteroides sp. AF48-14]
MCIWSTKDKKNKCMTKRKITREEALAKFQAAKEKKQECLTLLEKSMKETYKERTGKDAEKFFAL